MTSPKKTPTKKPPPKKKKKLYEKTLKTPQLPERKDNVPDLHLLNTVEMGAVFRVSGRTFQRRVNALRIPKFRVGRKIFFDPYEVVEHIRRLRNRRGRTQLEQDEYNKSLLEELSEVNMAGPLRVRADMAKTSPSGAHIFCFGKTEVIFPRQSFDIAHIDQLDNELGLWIGVTLVVSGMLVDFYSLREYMV